MNLKMIHKYVCLCKEFNKQITFEGMRDFKRIFSE